MNTLDDIRRYDRRAGRLARVESLRGEGWRDEPIGLDGDRPITRCPWITGVDRYVDAVNADDLRIDPQRAA